METENLKMELREIGMSDSEATIYLSLLKTGERAVAEISQDTGLHRTNIYDSLEKLKEKGFISQILKENKKFYRAGEPKSVIGYLKEKEERISKIIPSLEELQLKIKEKVIVEVFKGEKGMKSALRDILLTKKEVIGYNVSGQLRKYLPKFSEYYFIEQEKHKIKHKFIYTEGIGKPMNKFYEVKSLPKEYSGTTITLSYEDNTLTLIWEPEMVAIKIKSKQLAEDYRKHFNLLWKKAKP
jgi:sugar-specific transcriptional regulator TrmB